MIRFTDTDGIEHEFTKLEDTEQLAFAIMRTLGMGSAAVVAAIAPPSSRNETRFFYGWAGPSLSLLGLATIVTGRLRELVTGERDPKAP